jgi:Na+-driven multidrug efflux pump
MRSQLVTARDLTLRTLGFFVAFVAATAVAARMGDPELAAHQIGMQLWTFTALFLDSTAIAAQALVGRLLGADALEVALRLARRLLYAGALLGAAFALVLAAGYELVPRIFTGDGRVVDQAHVLWPFLVLMMPVNGVLFALDGIFIGAGDMQFMRNVTLVAGLAGYLPVTLATATLGWGLGGLWLGLSMFVWIRLVLGLVRWRRRRWLVGGRGLADDAPARARA